MTSLFNIGLSSLFASQQALSVSSQNIANAHNAFYSRRTVDLAESWGGWQQSGVRVMDIRRIFDDVANRKLFVATAEFSRAESSLKTLKDFENRLENGGNHIGLQINETLKALKALNGSTTDMQSRQLFVSQLQNLASRFNALDNDILKEQRNCAESLRSQIEFVNDTTDKIAKLNDRISTSGQTENLSPLLDERDRLVNELSKRLSFDISRDERGRLSLTLGNGLPLVNGTQSWQLETFPSPSGEAGTEIGINIGGTRQVITPGITQGEIASLIAWQNQTLKPALNTLNRLALIMADKMNAQNRLGVDSTGSPGQDIFTDINSSTMQTKRVIRNPANVGNGTAAVTITDASRLDTNDFILQFDSPTHYRLLRKSDFQEVQSGNVTGIPLTIQADGFSISLTGGNYEAGDRFTLSPTAGAAEALRVTLPDAGKLASGYPITAEPSVQNRGTGIISVTDILDTANSAFSTPMSLSPPVRIEFITPTSYRLVNANDNSVIEDNLTYNPGQEIPLFPTPGGYDPGYRVSLSGDMQAGDNFLIDYNRQGSADNRNGMKMVALFETGVLDSNTLTFGQAWNALRQDITSQTWAAQIVFDTQSILMDQAELRRHEISGVSLEEEVMTIARLEETVNASIQIINAAKSMFEAIIGITRSGS